MTTCARRSAACSRPRVKPILCSTAGFRPALLMKAVFPLAIFFSLLLRIARLDQPPKAPAFHAQEVLKQFGYTIRPAPKTERVKSNEWIADPLQVARISLLKCQMVETLLCLNR